MGRILEIGPANSSYYGTIELDPKSYATVFGPIPHFPTPAPDFHYPSSGEAGRFNKSNHKALIALAGISGTLAGCVQFGSQAQEVRDVSENNPSRSPESPGIEFPALQEENQEQNLIFELFDGFLAENINQYSDEGNIGLAKKWFRKLGIPKEALKNIEPFPDDLINYPTDEVLKYLRVIKQEDNIPLKGDVLITWPTSESRSRVGIATGDWVEDKESGEFYAKVLTQDYGKPVFIDSFHLDDTVGWLRSRQFDDSEGTEAQITGVRTANDLDLKFPFNGVWYFTGGPHSDGLSNGTRYAVDFASEEVYPCPGSDPLTGNPVIASESGKVITVGDEKDPEHHSIVEIQDDREYILGYMHLANISVELGEDVKTGTPLGDPSCEVPPGVKTTEIHLQEYLKDPNGKPIPIDGVVFSGYTVAATQENYDGMLLGYTGDEYDPKSASTIRCGPDATLEACTYVRNDVINGESETGEGEVLGAIESPFVPDNPEQFARYHLTNQWIEDYLISSRGMADMNTGEDKWWISSSVKMSDEDKERLKQNLAKGKEAGPISFYYYSMDVERSFQEGNIYVVPMRVIKVEADGISLESQEYEDDGRNSVFGDRASDGVFAGEFRFKAKKLRYGVADLTLKMTPEGAQSLGITYDVNFDFVGFDKITNFSPWQSGESRLDAIAYDENGGVECYSPLLPDGGAMSLQLCLNVEWDQNGQPLRDMVILTQFGITEDDVLNSSGYNGEFVIEP